MRDGTARRLHRRVREQGKPAPRYHAQDLQRRREAGVQARHTAEARRTEVERRLADAKLETGRLEGDLALAAERLRNSGQRRATAAQRREQEEAHAFQAERDQAVAEAHGLNYTPLAAVLPLSAAV